MGVVVMVVNLGIRRAAVMVVALQVHYFCNDDNCGSGVSHGSG